MRKRYVLDANVLASIVNSDDAEHYSCYSFYRGLDDQDKARWIVPGVIFFEFQATQSRRYRGRGEGRSVYRQSPLHHKNTELYHITKKFLLKVHQLDLYNRFSLLRGADLLYACIARVENIPLVTHDRDFEPYKNELKLIRPRDLIRHPGTIAIRRNGKRYKVDYEMIEDGAGGIVRLDTGQVTHLGMLPAKQVARLLFEEMIKSGLADKLKLWSCRKSN